MSFGRRELLVAAVAVVITAAGLVALTLGSLRGAIGALLVLMLGSLLLHVLSLRHVALRQKSLDRIEQKLDVVARRVVTESEATGRELGLQIEALRQQLRHE